MIRASGHLINDPSALRPHEGRSGGGRGAGTEPPARPPSRPAAAQRSLRTSTWQRGPPAPCLGELRLCPRRGRVTTSPTCSFPSPPPPAPPRRRLPPPRPRPAPLPSRGPGPAWPRSPLTAGGERRTPCSVAFPAAPPGPGGHFVGSVSHPPPQHRAAGSTVTPPPPHPGSPCGGRREAGPCRPTRNPLWRRCYPSRQRGDPQPPSLLVTPFAPHQPTHDTPCTELYSDAEAARQASRPPPVLSAHWLLPDLSGPTGPAPAARARAGRGEAPGEAAA